MTIELHTWNTPNGRKICVALEEMGLPYKVIPVNITKGEQMAPDFLAHQPEQQDPGDRRSRRPGRQAASASSSPARSCSISARRPANSCRSRCRAHPGLEWLMWQMGGFGPMPGQVHHFIALENEQDRAYGLKRYMAETRRLYGVLDSRLADHDSSPARSRSPISPSSAGPGGTRATRSSWPISPMSSAGTTR